MTIDEIKAERAKMRQAAGYLAHDRPCSFGRALVAVRAGAVLRILEGSRRPLTLDELADRSAVPMPAVRSILRHMEKIRTVQMVPKAAGGEGQALEVWELVREEDASAAGTPSRSAAGVMATAALLAFLSLPILADSEATIHPLAWEAVPTSASQPVDTHVSIEGYAQWTRREKDGDIHVRLCERRKGSADGPGRCVVAEIVPQVALGRPPAGKRAPKIRVVGVTRWDHRHGWFEVHPVTSWERVP